MREDKNKVPDDFPKMMCIGRIWSEDGKPYQPYYKAKDVWKWFKDHEKIQTILS
jgi:hypothetical protein